MRAGGCTVQQSLTAEAVSVVKQAVALARRRGHAQVTPLHLANTMLTASTGLLRTACLQSHSHPLQCKALELCFNIALNRLPASTSGSMLGTHSHHHQHFPSISNALVASFKRAQAHQRRGSIENQQQPLLAVNIELEQLMISILDDPSVSRVMREAGFSSTQVKSNVEQAVSLEIRNSQSMSSSSSTVKYNRASSANVLDQTNPKFLDPIRNEDVMSVIENLMNGRRKNSVIVGECVSTIEGVVKGVMDKFDKGDVPEGLRDVKLTTLSLSSLGHLSIIEQKLEEINSLMIKNSNSRGFVLYLGNLKWIIEQRSSEQAEHLIREIGRLVVCESGRFWILGIATFQTYMRCKTSYASLQTIWGLHPLTIPANSLCLSLFSATGSDLGSQSKSNKAENGHSWILLEGEELTCCAECSANFEAEAKSLHRSTNSSSCSTSSTLPAWLQQYKNESQRPKSMDQDCLSIKDLSKKWNSICSLKHHRRPYSSEKTLTFSSLFPSPSTSAFSYDQHGPNLRQTHHNFSVVEPKMPWRDHNHHWITETVNEGPTESPNLRIYMPPSTSNPNSTQNSASSSDVMEIEYVQKFNEYNSDNLRTLCNALEGKLPSEQKDIIQDIVSTILQCRSGMVKRKDKRETWLLFQGNDVEAKEKIAKELSRLIFGRTANFVSISLSSFSSKRADSTDHHQGYRNCKRSRDEQSCSYIERFVEAVSSSPHRVFLVEDVEQADYCSQIGIKRAIERGKVSTVNGVEVGLSDAIIILSCESFISRSRACAPPIKDLGPTMEETISSHCVSTLDLNVSIEDDTAEDQSIDDIGLLDSVDRRFVFKRP